MTRPFRLQAVLFDFDGTLTEPGAIDFEAIRMAIGCPSGTPILEFIAVQSDAARKAELYSILEGIELVAASVSRPNVGAVQAVRGLKSRGVPVAVISRNGLASIERALENFADLGPDDFDVIVSHDVPLAPKPTPDTVFWAADRLGVDPSGCLVVGDYGFDVRAGKAAGAVTVLVRNHSSPAEGVAGDSFADWARDADFVIDDLTQLDEVVRLGLPLPTGKFPNDLLGRFLADLIPEDPALFVRPRVGEDVAVVDLSAAGLPGAAGPAGTVPDLGLLVLKSDPITFATDSPGRYAVLVNANDVATSGATPRWLLATCLFPANSTPSEILATLTELRDACSDWGITLCGGHTEITDAVTHAVVVGALVGTVARDGLIDKHAMREGDRVLLTKRLAVEGTALIARELGPRLLDLGMTAEEIERCRAFLSRVSILPEARVAAASGVVAALHDVTEGGLATALEEFGLAGGHRIRADLDRIPVFPETRRVCQLLGIDPLGLIGSGSLLIACRPGGAASLIAQLTAEGIEATIIGEVLEPAPPGGAIVEGMCAGAPAEWPRFAVDEVARLF
jgi:hydrogenase expression/formation protein HypE